MLRRFVGHLVYLFLQSSQIFWEILLLLRKINYILITNDIYVTVFTDIKLPPSGKMVKEPLQPTCSSLRVFAVLFNPQSEDWMTSEDSTEFSAEKRISSHSSSHYFNHALSTMALLKARKTPKEFTGVSAIDDSA